MLKTRFLDTLGGFLAFPALMLLAAIAWTGINHAPKETAYEAHYRAQMEMLLEEQASVDIPTEPVRLSVQMIGER